MNVRINFLLISFFAISILPFTFLFLFNHPSPEDFSWGETVRSMGFFEAQKFFYEKWSGRFFSYLLLSVNPLLFKSIVFYKIFMLIFFLIFVYIFFVFVSAFSKSELSFRERALLAISILFVYLYSMPSISEGLYWLTSVSIYQLGISLIMLSIILYKISSVQIPGSKRNMIVMSVFLVTIFAIGTSEIITFLILCITVFAFLIKYLKINFNTEYRIPKIGNKIFLLFIMSVVISAAFVFSSPGNSLRALEFDNSKNFLYSFNTSFVYLFRNLFSWIFLSPLLPVSILLSPLLIKLFNVGEAVSKRKMIYKIGIKYLGLFLILYAVYFITIWNIGESPYGRTVNIVYFIFLVGWFYNLSFVLKFIQLKFDFEFQQFSNRSIFFILIVISLFLIKSNNIKIAGAELIRGSAINYDKNLTQRYIQIENSNTESCVVDSIRNKPRTFFLYDITGNADNPYNLWYSKYFNKKSIILKSD